MSVNESDSQENRDSDPDRNKMLRRAADSKFSALLPVDAENYMLRGIGRPAPIVTPEVLAFMGDMDHQGVLVDNTVPVPTLNGDQQLANTSRNGPLEDDFWSWESSAGDVEKCARIVSFHSKLCKCVITCCCNCGPLCSVDCHACFHNYCLDFFADYPCQKDTDALPPVTLDYDKVSLIIFHHSSSILN